MKVEEQQAIRCLWNGFGGCLRVRRTEMMELGMRLSVRVRVEE